MYQSLHTSIFLCLLHASASIAHCYGVAAVSLLLQPKSKLLRSLHPAPERQKNETDVEMGQRDEVGSARSLEHVLVVKHAVAYTTRPLELHCTAADRAAWLAGTPLSTVSRPWSVMSDIHSCCMPREPDKAAQQPQPHPDLTEHACVISVFVQVYHMVEPETTQHRLDKKERALARATWSLLDAKCLKAERSYRCVHDASTPSSCLRRLLAGPE